MDSHSSGTSPLQQFTHLQSFTYLQLFGQWQCLPINFRLNQDSISACTSPWCLTDKTANTRWWLTVNSNPGSFLAYVRIFFKQESRSLLEKPVQKYVSILFKVTAVPSPKAWTSDRDHSLCWGSYELSQLFVLSSGLPQTFPFIVKVYCMVS